MLNRLNRVLIDWMPVILFVLICYSLFSTRRSLERIARVQEAALCIQAVRMGVKVNDLPNGCGVKSHD